MGRKLTNHTDTPFELCFKYPLERGYTLTELSKKNVKSLQAFLNKVANMTVNQVNALYAKAPDKNDNYRGMQVYHYGITESFRIHVVNEAGYYKIVRLDPNHSYHR